VAAVGTHVEAEDLLLVVRAADDDHDGDEHDDDDTADNDAED